MYSTVSQRYGVIAKTQPSYGHIKYFPADCIESAGELLVVDKIKFETVLSLLEDRQQKCIIIIINSLEQKHFISLFFKN